MNRASIILMVAMGIVSVAGCDSREQRVVVVPEASKPGPNVALGSPTAQEREDKTAPPVQGQVDPKEQAQRRDFEQKK